MSAEYCDVCGCVVPFCKHSAEADHASVAPEELVIGTVGKFEVFGQDFSGATITMINPNPLHKLNINPEADPPSPGTGEEWPTSPSFVVPKD